MDQDVKGTSKPFAAWLCASMRARDVTQAEVARQLGVADAQVSRWRRGHVVPSRRHIHRIAAAFHVPVDTVEHLAGYDATVNDLDAGSRIDPVHEAEEQAAVQTFREILEQKVPRGLWGAYVKGCEALAHEMTHAFERALETGKAEPARRIGFHVGAVDDDCLGDPTN